MYYETQEPAVVVARRVGEIVVLAVSLQTISHYRILQKLGAGGMGEVYLAEDAQLDRRVAIKFLPPESTADERAKKRLIREAKAAAKLDHPNICSIFEVGQEDGRAFIVMQYVEGETLASRIQRKPLEIKEAIDIAVQIADALVEAHHRGIIHRDIKPANIMIAARSQVKLMDFGLASEVQRTSIAESAAETQTLLTEPGTIIGTVSYMSPEQLRSDTLDGRSDLFSFGVVLYEMVTGRQPFASESAAATFSAILTREPTPLTRYSEEAPAEMQRIIRKCLEKSKEERYQSARDLLIDLRNLRRESESSSLISPEVAPSRSNRRYVAYSALGLLVLALASIGVYILNGAGKAIDSLAVLPFVNANSDPNIDYLSDGIPESIINSLSQLPHLKVMSRNSVFGFKGREVDAQQVGKKLAVRAVLTGRVTQRGDNLAISIELIDARDNSQIWGQNYNRRLADVFAIQEEIAKEVSEKLRLKLTGPEQQQLAKRHTGNVKAFEYYTQGRSHLGLRTREELLSAIAYYEKAIGEDSSYALAYAGIAEVYANLGGRGYLPPVEARRKAEKAVEKALALDEDLAEAHLAIGEISVLFGPFDFARADRALQRALELSPNLASVHQYLGNSYVLRARYDDALREFLKARELDPLSSILARLVVGPYYYQHDYARAMDLLRQANELRPSYLTLWEVGVYIKSNEFDYAWAELEKEKQQRKDDAILIESAGKLYAAQGRREEALQVIKELEKISGPDVTQGQYIAAIYAVLGEKELAFNWLNRSVEAGTIWFFIKDDPLWDPLRADPRFDDALRRMGIPT
jgi:eukaryotic-like serine/threonine-protein kinase